MVETRFAQGIDGLGCRRAVRRAVEGGRAAAATAVTPALIEAAKKEGKLSFYSALELNTAERLARTFEAKYPGH